MASEGSKRCFKMYGFQQCHVHLASWLGARAMISCVELHENYSYVFQMGRRHGQTGIVKTNALVAGLLVNIAGRSQVS